MSDDDVVRWEVADRVATITLNRPDARNALSAQVLEDIRASVVAAEADDHVDVMIVTGADPAFCAGVDLKEAGAGRRVRGSDDPVESGSGPFPRHTKPLIGAVNGVAVTGGLELALQCDFLIASERARFADTHSRVGVQPGWGLTVLLPQAIGIRRARQMSATGNYVDASQALAWGLVNEVVAHDRLLPRCREIATDICSNDQDNVRQLFATYDLVAAGTVTEGWDTEKDRSQAWPGNAWDPAQIEARRQAVVDRGRAQQD
jgi:enoyl-CoA hydratase